MPLCMLDTDTCAFVMRGPFENLRAKLLATPIDEQAISLIVFNVDIRCACFRIAEASS